MTIAPDVVGIDVSKDTLDLFDISDSRYGLVLNQSRPVGELADRLAAAGRFVVFEATGDYDRLLRRELERAGVPYSRVNPGQARDFARAAGFLAKTDKVDCRMLARFGQALQPQPTPAADPDRERLARLHRRRDQLVATRKQERTRRSEAADADVLEDIQAHLDWLDSAIAKLDGQIAELIATGPELARDGRLIRSVPGLGAVNTSTLLALVPELGRRSPKTIAALIGLAPINNDSGQHRGRRSIRGGRKRVRDALYMAAVSASRSKSRFGDLYRALIAAKKPPKLALIALARRILVTVNAIVRDQQPFRA